MQPKFLFVSLTTSLFLAFLCIAQTVSAQTRPAALNGHWQGQGYALYLHQGLFLLQAREKVSYSGAYQVHKECLVLNDGNGKQVFRVIQHGNLLVLMGAEVEIKLQADKNYAPRNILLGMINEIQPSHLQETPSSQLPGKYFN